MHCLLGVRKVGGPFFRTPVTAAAPLLLSLSMLPGCGIPMACARTGAGVLNDSPLVKVDLGPVRNFVFGA
jgi:hypothetical protein